MYFEQHEFGGAANACAAATATRAGALLAGRSLASRVALAVFVAHRRLAAGHHRMISPDVGQETWWRGPQVSRPRHSVPSHVPHCILILCAYGLRRAGAE